MSSDRDEFGVFHRSERCVISLEREVDEHVVILQLQNAIWLTENRRAENTTHLV